MDQAPDDGANWGNAISTTTKFRNDDSSDSDGSETDTAVMPNTLQFDKKQLNPADKVHTDSHGKTMAVVINAKSANRKKVKLPGKVYYIPKFVQKD